jgi:hypothetical protein
MSAIGVDKIGLTAPLSLLKIRPDFASEVTSRRNGATGEALKENLLYTDQSGRSVTGIMATVNTPNYQATFTAGRDGKPLFALQFSGCAVASNNVVPLDRDRLVEAVRKVGRDLEERGCVVDLERLSLYRLDATRNNEMQEPTSSYFPLLAAGGMRKTTRRNDFGGTGFVVGPKSKIWEAAGYDKEQELLFKGYEMGLCDPNTLRIEARALKGAAVRNIFGVRTVEDVIANWENIKAGFITTVKANVVKLPPNATNGGAASPQSLEDAAVAEMRQFEDELGANWWRLSGSILRDSYWVNRYGLKAASAAVGRVLGNETDTAKKHTRRVHQLLEQAAHRRVLEATAPSGRVNAVLYEEIKSKLLAA